MAAGILLSAPAFATNAPVETKHTVTLNGKEIAYTAKAGYLDIGAGQNQAPAKMFFISYTVPSSAERPLIFLFNGGPGAASVFLNVGAFGPKRVDTAAPKKPAVAPYQLTNNPQSLLGVADLVFIDAVGTGYSRANDAGKNAQYFTTDADTAAFAEAINRYVTENKRWNAPKFLLGESYGGTRAAALALRLQNDGVALNGVILLSPILNFAPYEPGIETGYVNTLPSFAATAWYHHKAKTEARDIQTFLAEVRRFAFERYLPALEQGDTLPQSERDAIAATLSDYTGLPANTIKKANLHISVGLFCTQLLADDHAILGVMDTRVKAPSTGQSTTLPFDAADAYTPAFVSSFQRVLSDELGLSSPEPYRFFVPGLDQRWDWHHTAPDGTPLTTPDMGLDLAAAMRANPRLQLMVMHGYYDLSTPFFGTEYDISHMPLPQPLRDNIRFTYFDGGHMLYLSPEVQVKATRSIEEFLSQTLALQ